MKKSLLLILAFALCSCGCSTIGLVYRNADWYLEHKINGYTSFDSPQKATIRKDVSDYMSWHHRVALPEYIIFLQNLNGVAQNSGRLGVEDVTQLRLHLQKLYDNTVMPAIPPVAKLLASLNSGQIQELGKTFSKEIRKKKEEELDIGQDRILEKRADKTIDFLVWLAGELSSEQETKIREMSSRLPVVNNIYIRNRESYQRKLIALLSSGAGPEKIADFLSSWFITPEETSPGYQQHAIEAFERASDEMVVDVHALLTVKQRQHIHQMISSYIEDMRSFNAGAHVATGTYQ